MYHSTSANYDNALDKMQRYSYSHDNALYDSDDADSICQELAYPKADMGHYSDAGYQSPGLNLDHYGGQQGLFAPLEVPKRACQQMEATSVKDHMDFANTHSGQRLYKIPSSCVMQNRLKNFDMPSKISQYSPAANQNCGKSQCKATGDFSSHRLTNMKTCIQNSDFFYVPQQNMLLRNNHQSPNFDVLTKEENISPVTISSGYSSDKDEALRQLDLEYNSDASDHSPKLKPRSLHLSPKQTTEREESKHSYAIKPDEYYHNIDVQNKRKSHMRYDQTHKSEWKVQSPNKCAARSAALNGHVVSKSKDAAYNRRNSIAVNPSCLNSLEQVNSSFSSLVISSSDCQASVPSKALHTSAIMDNQNMPTSSNDSITKVERLPEITRGESFQHVSGILMTPEASTNCRRCFSFSQSPIIQGPSQDYAHLRISKDSAFRPVKSSPRSKSTPPESFYTVPTRKQFRSGEGLELSYVPHYFEDDIKINCPPHLLMKTDSRVTSLSEDSGRGSASSIDLALSDITPSIYGGSVFSSIVDTPRNSTPIYQDIPREQVYERVPEAFRQPTVRHEEIPPQLPKRNPRKSNRPFKSHQRKASSLVKYEDIVKPQDIVDASAMHMYTVADVLKSVDLLASDIPQSSNEMCVHENYAHFVFADSPASRPLERSSSHSSIKDLKPHLSIYQNTNYTDMDRMISREVPHDLSLPIRPRQNTACEAQTKRLPKIQDEPQTLCNSPYSKNRSRNMNQNLSTPHTFPRDAPKRRVNRSGLSNRSPSLSNLNFCSPNASSISWSTAKGNMTEVYC